MNQEVKLSKKKVYNLIVEDRKNNYNFDDFHRVKKNIKNAFHNSESEEYFVCIPDKYHIVEVKENKKNVR